MSPAGEKQPRRPPVASGPANRGPTRSVYYRDADGTEPVNEWLEALMQATPLAAAKIDDYIEEYLNGRDPDEPPPEHPITSKSKAGCASCASGSHGRATGFSTSARAILLSCSTASRRTLAASLRGTSSEPSSASRASGREWTRRPANLHARPATTRRPQHDADQRRRRADP